MLRRISYRKERVVLSSGRTSDFFIDCKPTLLTARGHVLAGELMLDALRQIPAAQAVAGVELGGCPLASAVSTLSQLRGRPVPALYVRKAAKEHGTRRLVEGPLVPGMHVVLLEDVVTTGGSTLRAAEVLRYSGALVVGVIALVDRVEGGAEAIQGARLPFLSLYTRHDFEDVQDPLASTWTDTDIKAPDQ